MGVTDDIPDLQADLPATGGVALLGPMRMRTDLPGMMPPVSPPRSSRTPRDIAAAHAMLERVFERIDALEAEYSVLRTEQREAEELNGARAQDAGARIHDLEDAVAGLMDVIRQYETLLASANVRIADAEQRAADAEHWIRTAERGTSEAVEWLYHHVTNMLDEPR